MDFGKFVWVASVSQDRLIKQGFFGKGTLSRSIPTWDARREQVNNPRLELAPEQVTAKRRSKRREQKQLRAGMQVTATNPEEMYTMEELAAWTGGRGYEQFQLDLYETFFLLYALDVLDLENKHGTKMTTTDCWSLFHQCTEQFAYHFAAYHYYRSQGWVPKDGLKFGVDFVLYQQGPTSKHSDFSVLVIPCVTTAVQDTSDHHDTTMQLLTQPHDQAPHASWVNLLRINRVCAHVKKTLVLCYVSMDASVAHKATNDPSVLNHCHIHEVVFRRWSPSANRE
ncbi:tRNA-intron endonuclease catalytic domain-like protein [Hesseltinella vesiculosa]|uniref:tRNA-splicing endonuclease subunit Sen2 n=1 Tax=Hesseltinella vesiculosa TaxID=101127 RepID=A0A1X2GNI6_9FUNG|nr:tRNA-intron endonuclease catalytic domain-like protein [Hesseltinella vesiculosa]